MQRLAIVGLGHRAGRFIDAATGPFRGGVALAAFCDSSAVRMAAHNARLRDERGLPPVPSYSPDRFEDMLRRERADTVLVATVDSAHDEYIVRGLEAGCRVITEKPMTVDAARCRRILAAADGRSDRLRVAFNYRWAPPNAAVRRLLAGGAIGRVRSVVMEWLLDVRHGADYFRRWHSDKAASGGLLVHKATHHFDLVNWWTDSIPESVFAMGGLMFYGRDNAIARGDGALTAYPRYTGEPRAADDPFRLDLSATPAYRALYLAAEAETGYVRDRNVFREGISIEDNLGVLVRYRGGMMLSYVLNAFSPREGMRVVFNGDRGRVEYTLFARSNAGPAPDHESGAAVEPPGESLSLRVYPHFGPARTVPAAVGEGGHWGGDPLLFRNLFADGLDELGCAAGPEQGAASLLVGAAGNVSIAEGRPVELASMLPLKPEAGRLGELW